MQAVPGRSDGWWISPAIPTIANCALAALWLFSALGGWGEAAFCGEGGEGGEHDPVCGAAFGNAVRVSIPVAALAAVIALTARTRPGLRRRVHQPDILLTATAVTWVLAEGVLLAGGHLAKG